MRKTSEDLKTVARAMACGPGLRRLRAFNFESLRAVADMVRVHCSHLSRLERGLRGASVAMLWRLAGYYGFGSVKQMLRRAEQLQAKWEKRKKSCLSGSHTPSS
jgi:transcriptional regulator with XRE-family HTH domain